MSLFRQQIIGIITVFSSTLIIFVLLYGYQTKNLLQEQHQNQLNHTANQLNWMLETQYKTVSMNTQKIQLSEYLDPDHYNYIRIDDLVKNTHYTINREAVIHTVPDWFIRLGLLSTLKEQRLIHYNWKKVANLTIERTPYAEYQWLWRFVYQAFFSLLLFVFITFSIFFIVIKRQLSPLEKLSQRCKQSLHQPHALHLPNQEQYELQYITLIINKLTYKVTHQFKIQAKETKKIQSQTYHDLESGLNNRLFFKEQLEAWLEETHQGGVIMIRTDLLTDAKQKLNFKDAEAIIKELCTLLKSATEQEDVILARCSENELAILMRSISLDKLRPIGDMLDALLQALHHHHPLLQNVRYNIAMLHNQKQVESREIFSRLDNALSVLEQSSSNTLSLQTDEDSDPIFGRLEWKALIETAIHKKQFKHKMQSIYQHNGEIHHLELFSAIETKNGNYQPTQFLGAIETLEIGASFDQYVINYAIQHLTSDLTHPPMAVNLTQSSVKDPAFMNWLNSIMKNNQTLKTRLYFEIPEVCFYRQKESAYLFCDNIRHLNFTFGIDNYGRYFSDLNYVHEIKPNYVKIDYIYTYHLNDKLRSETLSSLCRTAHSLDITTIATKVETETQKNRLSELFVCAYQGYINRELEKA